MPLSHNLTPSEPMESKGRHDFWLVLLRGFLGRCPRCGKGRLLRNYLKPVDQCSACAQAYGHIRADDGPAWLTIVLVGHILGPILLLAIPNSTWPDWLSMLVWPSFALLLALVILPRAKGVFIALIWRTGGAGSEK